MPSGCAYGGSLDVAVLTEPIVEHDACRLSTR
jgi:hypothetical protein